jgi:hypothetical protein
VGGTLAIKKEDPHVVGTSQIAKRGYKNKAWGQVITLFSSGASDSIKNKPNRKEGL